MCSKLLVIFWSLLFWQSYAKTPCVYEIPLTNASAPFVGNFVFDYTVKVEVLEGNQLSITATSPAFPGIIVQSTGATDTDNIFTNNCQKKRSSAIDDAIQQIFDEEGSD